MPANNVWGKVILLEWFAYVRGSASRGSVSMEVGRGSTSSWVCLGGVSRPLGGKTPRSAPGDREGSADPSNQKSRQYTSYRNDFLCKNHPVVSKVMDCSGGSRTGVGGGVKDKKIIQT